MADTLSEQKKRKQLEGLQAVMAGETPQKVTSPTLEGQLQSLTKQLFSQSTPGAFDPVTLPQSRIIKRNPLPGESVRTSGKYDAPLESVQGPVYTNFIPSSAGSAVEGGDERLITGYGPTIIDATGDQPVDVTNLVRGLMQRIEEGPDAIDINKLMQQTYSHHVNPRTGQEIVTGLSQGDIVNDPLLLPQFFAENERRAKLRDKFQEANIKAYQKTVENLFSIANKSGRSVTDTIINSDRLKQLDIIRELNDIPETEEDVLPEGVDPNSDIGILVSATAQKNKLKRTAERQIKVETLIDLLLKEPEIKKFLTPRTLNILEREMSQLNIPDNQNSTQLPPDGELNLFNFNVTPEEADNFSLQILGRKNNGAKK